MEKKHIKLFSETYDKLHDLDSAYHYKFDKLLKTLEDEVKKEGYIFKLNDRTQKFKLVEYKTS